MSTAAQSSSTHRADEPRNPGRPDEQSGRDTIHPIAQNIETVAELFERAERRVDVTQRRVERIAGFIGRPHFIILVTAGIVLWMVGNAVAKAAGLRVWDAPPFYWLQGTVSLASLYTTLVVVVSQNRLSKVQEQRDNLELQAILLTEQKVTKIIALLEELRHDLPEVTDRADNDAEVLQETLDPNAVLTALELKLDHSANPAE